MFILPLRGKKIIKDQSPHIEEYSPSQSPLWIEEEQLTGEKTEQLGSQGGIFITQVELDEGNPQEPPMPSLELKVVDFKGTELDPMIEQASQQFLLDDNFVKSRTFHQFAWRTSIGKYEERFNKIRKEHPELEEAALQNQVKEKMIQEFQNITPKEGRRMVRASNILLLPNWDIVDALIFNFVSNKLDV